MANQGRWLNVGASLVVAVTTDWAHLPHNEFRVLITMAVTALDKPSKGREPRIYFGGRDQLAKALRTPWPTCGSCDDEANPPKPCPEHHTPRTTLYKTVQAAVATLVQLKAIERIGDARDGRRQRYRILVNVEAP